MPKHNPTHEELYPTHYRSNSGRCGFFSVWQCHPDCSHMTERYYTVNDDVRRRRTDVSGSEHDEHVAHCRTAPIAWAVAESMNMLARQDKKQRKIA